MDEAARRSIDGASHAPTRRRADIQGLRAVAVAMVVAFHAGLPPAGGYIGVDVFFVISGFVVGGVLIRELGRGSGLGFRSFYVRRVRRLLPALALMTTVVAAASTLLLSPLTTQRSTARTGIAASLFVANIQLANVPRAGYFGVASSTNALLHTWSLSVEEQFYLGFPALLAALWWFAARRSGRTDARRRVVVGVLAALAAASLALCLVTTYHPSERLGTTFAFYMAPSRAWEFAAGVLLALVAHRLTRIPPALAIVLGAVGAGVLAYGAFTFDGATTFPGLAAMVPVVGTVLLIAAGTVTERGAPQLLSLRPVVWIGDVSYGWYLWHWPLIVFATVLWPGHEVVVAAVALLSLVPTALSYRFVENPIRFAPGAADRRVWPLAATCILVPIAAFAGVLVLSHVQARSATVASFRQEIREHQDRAHGCDVPAPIPERTSGDCTWTTAGAAGDVYLVGDSNAGHFAEPMITAAEETGYDLTIATSAGCPFADIILQGPAGDDFDGPACRESVQASVDELVRRKPALVVVAMSASEWINDGSRLIDPDTGEVGRTPDTKGAVYEAGLRRTLQQLDDAGIPTAVVHTVPQFNTTLGDTWTAETCAAVQIYLDRCGGSRSLAGVEREQAPGAAAEDGATEGLRASTTLGVDDVICRRGRCATTRGDTQLYRDASHLTVAGAELLTSRFQRLVEQRAAPA